MPSPLAPTILRSTWRLVASVSLMLGILAPPAVSPAGSHPAARYLEKVVVDQFNPDVTEADRANPSPRRGGQLVIRTPADFQELNVLTLTGQPEMVVVSHLSDSLVDRDMETLEYYPEMAWHWREADLVRRKGEAVVEGRIIAHDATMVRFVPDAWIHVYNKFDLATIDEAGHFVVLKPEWGGARIEGRLTVYDHTVRVDEGYDSPKAAAIQEIPLDQLEHYKYTVGTFTDERPFIKEVSAFRFFIRPGVTWSDGQPFTGEDVRFSYETIMNPGVDCQHRRNYYQDIERCEVSDDGMTVTFHYAKPYFAAIDFLGGITGSTYFLPRHVFQPEQFGGDEKAFAEAFNKHPFREKPVYTGPYVLKEWKRGDRLAITRNPDYWKDKLPEGAIPRWKKGQPYLDGITWVLYQEAAAVTKDLVRGALDVDLDVEPTNWVSAETNDPLFTDQMVRAEQVGFLYTYIGWNLEREVFQDVNVRRALAMLIPREEIEKNVLNDVAFPVTGPFYVHGPGYDQTLKPIEHNPTEARRLLARAGWLDRDKDGVLEKKINGRDVPFEFSYSIHNARDYHQKIADIVKESVEQAGIRMTINKSDWTIFADTIRDKNFDAVRFAWGTDIEPDPFQIFHSSQIENKGDNFVSYRNARVDELCILIRETMDPEKRWELAREMHRIIYEDQPYCFLSGFRQTYYIDRKLRGVKLYPSQYPHDFTEWYWSEIPADRQ